MEFFYLASGFYSLRFATPFKRKILSDIFHPLSIEVVPLPTELRIDTTHEYSAPVHG